MANDNATSENHIPRRRLDATSKMVVSTHSEYHRESFPIADIFAALEKILNIYFILFFELFFIQSYYSFSVLIRFKLNQIIENK